MDQGKPDLIADPIVQAAMQLEGYRYIRKLPTGEWAALMRFMFTCGLVVGIDMVGYRTRYCYEFDDDALAALLEWNGEGDPPGPWIKKKGLGGEKTGPGAVGKFA